MKSPRGIILLLCLISAVILFGYPLLVDLSRPCDAVASEFGAVAVTAGIPGGSVIQITAPCPDGGVLCNARIYLVDPDGMYHVVGKGVFGSSESVVWYIFHYQRPEAGAPEYWITDDTEMVFTRTYIESVEPFEPRGIWMIEIVPLRDDAVASELSVAL
ncbi:hypothetical protein HWN36_10250 [Methanofollis tationis]|uniref:Uncharacterized protein n=1 Tax=Methanofollis tationis TaxID=81417 RepID=A0A7K4HR00_9EURY|nr:hypothetical protein [Methanofollis tationis]